MSYVKNHVYTNASGTYSVILTEKECRKVLHDEEEDVLEDKFKLTTLAHWYAMVQIFTHPEPQTVFDFAKRVVVENI